MSSVLGPNTVIIWGSGKAHGQSPWASCHAPWLQRVCTTAEREDRSASLVGEKHPVHSLHTSWQPSVVWCYQQVIFHLKVRPFISLLFFQFRAHSIDSSNNVLFTGRESVSSATCLGVCYIIPSKKVSFLAWNYEAWPTRPKCTINVSLPSTESVAPGNMHHPRDLTSLAPFLAVPHATCRKSVIW